MRVKYFDWDEHNIEHISGHDVSPEEVEEVFDSKPHIRKGRKKTYLAFGLTDFGRYLLVVFKYRGEETIRPITARDMTSKEKRFTDLSNDKMKRKNKLKPIPDFKSEMEEADFWSTHETTEYDFEETNETITLSSSLKAKIEARKREQKDEGSLKEILFEIQDYLMPRLDTYEQMLYHYLFRHSYLQGKDQLTIGIRSIQSRIGLGIGKAGSPPSQRVMSSKLRSLEKKGCVKVVSRSVQGTRIQIQLPHQIPGVIVKKPIDMVKSLEELDFFNTPELRASILKRDNNKCFYCLKDLSARDYALDHVHSHVSGGPNSYQNIVASCFECNSRKQAKEPNLFLLENYRAGLLTQEDYNERLKKLQQLESGLLVPEVEPFSEL